MEALPRFSTVSVGTGLKLHYAEYGPTSGTPVLFLHGWPDSWFSFSRVLERFPPAIRAIVPDQRGFGESDRPPEGYTVAQFADDAIALLDALAIPRAAVVGHSFGSFIARRMAIRHPGRVTRMALIGSGMFGGTDVVLEARASLHDLPEAVPIGFAREFQASTVYFPVPAEFFDRIVAESMKLPGPLWRAALDALLSYADQEELTSITTPALLLWGDHDALFSRSHQDQLVHSIRAATLKVYPETGHCPNWERPEEVASDLLAFLNEG